MEDQYDGEDFFDDTGGTSDPSLDQCNVFVKYLPPELEEREFQHMFRQYGSVVSSKIMIDQATGKSLGYGSQPSTSPLRPLSTQISFNILK